MKFGFLGPHGTFTQEALQHVSDATTDEQVPLESFEEVIDAVATGEVDQGIVPIENSVIGSVNSTLEILGFGDHDLRIQSEVIISVRLHLLAAPEATLASITDVYSVPEATGQCRRWLHTHAPDVRIHAANSTSEAAETVAGLPPMNAAIGNNLAAQLHGLTVLERDITDHHEAETRFVVVGRGQAARTGRDRTSIVCFIAKDHPGALVEFLHEFADRGINLTFIQSRPTKRVLGDYCFFIDLEGHEEDPIVAEALSGIESHVSRVRHMGSYPRAVGKLDAIRAARRGRARD